MPFDGATSVKEATKADPVALEYGFTFADGYALRFELPRVFLPKPKYAISGPGGVEASFDWRAAYGHHTACLPAQRCCQLRVMPKSSRP